jgi:hypothetical protein
LLSGRGAAAVDGDIGAGDVRGVGGSQESDEVGDLLGLGSPPEECRLGAGIEQFAIGCVGVDGSWRDGVDADAGGPVFGGPGAGEGGQCGFRGTVGGGVGLTDGAGSI